MIKCGQFLFVGAPKYFYDWIFYFNQISMKQLELIKE